MAAGDQLRRAAQDVRSSADAKKRQMADQTKMINDMKVKMDQMTQGLTTWQKEISDMEIQARDLERQANEADNAEKRMQQQKQVPK